ncbi:aldose epimerase family protein [Mucilaginibacter sp. CSA2-8R]|uniref:aldose epimerase family protein n=1 Tax=Mucilaginibacter sp. CSA2-8R TaxID=3141542 RepID=UPI00315CA2EE
MLLTVVCLVACNYNKQKDYSLAKGNPGKSGNGAISASAFNKEVNGKAVHLYNLRNTNGVKAQITNYGGRLVSLLVPNKKHRPTDVIVGFSSIDGYQQSTGRYYGAIVGRYANRIAKGKFTLDGKTYQLFVNKSPNTLHGGKNGFQDAVWDARQLNSTMLELKYLSKALDQGFPGNLEVKVIYELTDDNSLKISYQAVSNQNTVVNLTNHAFFNLNGEASGSILNHQVTIKASQFTPIDSTMIPTGKYEPIVGTPFDFTKPAIIGARINEQNRQLSLAKGYDHNYVLKTHTLTEAVAVAQGDKSGVVMTVYTTEPGLQFYSGNNMKGDNLMKNGHKDERQTAFCMETQHFPDSPNQPLFPSTKLKAGSIYKSTTIYHFGLSR